MPIGRKKTRKIVKHQALRVLHHFLRKTRGNFMLTKFSNQYSFSLISIKSSNHCPHCFPHCFPHCCLHRCLHFGPHCWSHRRLHL